MRLDVLFIHPNTSPLIYGSLAEDLAAVEPPFMAALLAAGVRQAGFSVDLLDAGALGLDLGRVAELVMNSRPRLVVIVVHGQQPSASSQMMGGVGDLCRAIKMVSDTKILLTGTHPAALPLRTLTQEAVDYVATGEGLDTILGLLQCRAEEGSYRRVPGLHWLQDGIFISSVERGEAGKELDLEYGSVAWDMLPLGLGYYRAHNWHAHFQPAAQRLDYASLYTSLGCPYKCSFCCINAPFRARGISGIRHWSADWVLNQVGVLVEQYGVRHLKFIDEMYCLDKRHVKGIARGIIKAGYDLNIWAYARVDTVGDEEMLELMARSGVKWLVLGIESANRNVRAGADKNFSNEAVVQAVERVERAGIDVLGNYMVGLRTDTQETMRETLVLAKQLKTLWFNLYATMAYPGAPDYGWAQSRGYALPGDKDVPGGWTAYSHHSYYTLPLPTETLSAAEVLRFRDQAFNDYFSYEPYLERVHARFGFPAINHINEMNTIKLKRRILGDKL